MGHTKSFIGFVFQGRVELEKVSISPTFYDQLSQTKVFWKAFLYLEFGFVFICRKNIGKKAAHKMLANLIKGVNFTDIFTSSFFMHSFVRQLLIKIFNFSDSESNLDTAGVTLETSLRCDSAPVMSLNIYRIESFPGPHFMNCILYRSVFIYCYANESLSNKTR